MSERKEADVLAGQTIEEELSKLRLGLDSKILYHEVAYETYERISFWMLLPIKVLPFLASSAAILSAMMGGVPGLGYTSTVLSIVVGLLVVLQDFFAYSKRAATSKQVRDAFTDLRRDLMLYWINDFGHIRVDEGRMLQYMSDKVRMLTQMEPIPENWIARKAQIDEPNTMLSDLREERFRHKHPSLPKTTYRRLSQFSERELRTLAVAQFKSPVVREPGRNVVSQYDLDHLSKEDLVELLTITQHESAPDVASLEEKMKTVELQPAEREIKNASANAEATANVSVVTLSS